MSAMNWNFYLHQVFTILGLFAAGWLFLAFLPGKVSKTGKLLLSYPAGLALWGVGGFLLLCVGIPFRPVCVFVLVFLLYSALLLYRFRFGKKAEGQAPLEGVKQELFSFLIAAVLVLALSLLVCSGLISVSISNDSVYYYSLYSQTLAKEGAYLGSFDVFLTDVGQVTAIIGTLPWFFGFAQTFGIQLLLGINLTAVFFAGVLQLWEDRFKGERPAEKKYLGMAPNALCWALFSTLLLVFGTPFQIMTRWILANAYFMTFLFLLVILARVMQRQEDRRALLLLSSLLITALCATRMEGGMMAGLLILCIAGLDIDSRELLVYYTIPVAFSQLLYYLVVYLKLSVNPLYSFLSFKNAFVMIAFLVVIFFYLLLIRRGGAFAKIKNAAFWNTGVGRLLFRLQDEHYPMLMLGCLLLGNLGLMAIDPVRFLGNLRFFGENIILQNGWGYFGFFVLLILIYLTVQTLTGRRRQEMRFGAFFTLSFILFTIALCWARGGSLRLGVGDSGNRVLMQVVPFVVYALTEALMGGKEERDVPDTES